MLTVMIDTAASAQLPAMTRFVVDSTSSSMSAAAGRRVPSSIPASQRYFWTRLWQAGEAESAEDIATGAVRRFDNPLDAVRWLLSGEDED